MLRRVEEHCTLDFLASFLLSEAKHFLLPQMTELLLGGRQWGGGLGDRQGGVLVTKSVLSNCSLGTAAMKVRNWSKVTLVFFLCLTLTFLETLSHLPTLCCPTWGQQRG